MSSDNSPSSRRTLPPSTSFEALDAGTFTCVACGLAVSGPADGEGRNHCPSCLHSRHVLDRSEGGPSSCRARMSPISVAVPRTGEWMLIHRCVRCGELTSGPVRTDDNQFVLMRMAVRPLAEPPFPLEAFGTL
ncbi:RNHCP domain-containing protein [Streptomyces sp. NPDC017254]|uniref:RNHCP domain-containing protein n=1 Tax=unclassified Streptomyces TaxID=2593676 RepID=UPI0037AC74F7